MMEEIPIKLLEITDGYLRSKALFTANELGIFDLLHNSDKPLTFSEVSDKLQTNPPATSIIMDACVQMELLIKTTGGEKGADVYTNTPMASRWLLKQNKHSLAHMFHHNNIAEYPQSLDLLDIVKSGKMPENVFNEFYKDRESTMRFLGGIHVFTSVSTTEVETAFDLSAFKRICDLGGGTGAFLHKIGRLYPEAELINFDLPHAVQIHPEFLPKELKDRYQSVAGDFFTDPLPQADLYILCQVLHDWNRNPERVKRILKKVYETCKSGANIMIVERLLDNPSNSYLSHTMSLRMLTICEGKELTGDEYKELLEHAGFTEIKIKHAPILGVVFGTKI